MATQLMQGDRRKPCCRDPRNLSPFIFTGTRTGYRRCQVCNCRHFVQEAEPGRFGVQPGGVARARG